MEQLREYQTHVVTVITNRCEFQIYVSTRCKVDMVYVYVCVLCMHCFIALSRRKLSTVESEHFICLFLYISFMISDFL